MLKIFRHSWSCLNFSRTRTDLHNNNLPVQRPDQLLSQLRFYHCPGSNCRPQHFVCYNNWNKDMVMKIVTSAINLKRMCQNTHGKKLNILPCTKVMIFEDHSEPILRLAVSKATSLLGASDVHITDEIQWDRDYNGTVFSEMADVIFVSTRVHECVKRFARCSAVPVVSMRCRQHATLQSLATIMSLMEDHGSLKSLNMAYIGAPHQVLNDYLILCAMLEMNFKFKCCCKKCAVSPLVFGDCKRRCENTPVLVKQVVVTPDAINNAHVIISGPTSSSKEKISEFQLSTQLINKHTKENWTFYHTFPRGSEVDDELFWHDNARTFNAFKNTQYIAAAIMVYVICGYGF